MNKVILTILCMLMAVAGFSQQKNTEQLVQEDTEKMVAFYELDANQTKQMQVIQARKYRNLAEIASLEATDRQLYLKKLKSIRQGTLASTKRLLRKDQLPKLQEVMMERRKQESAVIKSLKAEGKSKEAIEQALLEMEASK